MKQTTLSSEETLNLTLLKSKLALAEAREQVAQKNVELQDLALKYEVLRIFRKYNLPDNAKLGNDGKIEYEEEKLESIKPETERNSYVKELSPATIEKSFK